MGLKEVAHLQNNVPPWSFFLIAPFLEGEEPEEGAEACIPLLHREAEAAWIARALKDEAHLLRGDAESSGLNSVHFTPESPFSGAASYTNYRQYPVSSVGREYAEPGR